MTHIQYIDYCLDLANKGRGRVGSNPLVGAVLVRSGKIIAEGYHAGYGLVHAERMLLENFTGDIESSDVLYVNLMPCCHNGKTPPCTDIIRERGVKTVVYGMNDPYPLVAEESARCLRELGVTLIGPVDEARCRRFNKGYVSLQENGRPYITLKKAQTRDGRIANPDSSTLKITSQEQDEWSHQWLRGTHDAILAGVGTILADDPELTVRHGRKKSFASADVFQPRRIILDPDLVIPLDAKAVSGQLAAGTSVLTAQTDHPSIDALAEQGVHVLSVPLTDGHFDWDELLWRALTSNHDGHVGIASILVEGGQATWDTFKKAGLIDEEVLLIGS